MNTNRKLAIQWPLIVTSLVIVILVSACTGTTIGSANAVPGALLLNDGIVQVVNKNGDMLPVAGASTVELVGALESTDPWRVAGRTVQTTETTQIEEGLQVGDLVVVRGSVLDETVWLAYSIERAQEQTDATVTLVGEATSTNPWVVNGITLDVTDDTVINGEIEPGTMVRVEILLLEDGTWEVLSITPVGDAPDAPGCATVTATVESVNGDEVQFEGWPVVTLGEDVILVGDDGAEATLSPGQEVLVVVCATDDGQLRISQITILAEDEDESAGQEKVLVCHKPEKKGGHTLSIAEPAVQAHLAHGDTLGACP